MRVTYKDHMGSDLTVVNAARVSFSKESAWETYNPLDGTDFDVGEFTANKLSDKDKKLVKYLAEHNHFTPFAHPQIQLHVKAPIFVARQLVKHQVGLCLSGNTKVTFVKQANGVSNGVYTDTLSNIFKMWSGSIKYQGGSKGKQNVIRRNLRVWDSISDRFTIGHISNVVDSGLKDVYKLTDSDGNTVVTTLCHKFMTDKGWKSLQDISQDISNIKLKRNGWTVEAKLAARERYYTFNNFKIHDSCDIRTKSAKWGYRQRGFLFEKQEGKCAICFNEFDKTKMDIDHTLPVKDYPELSMDFDNIRMVCKECHLKKSAKEKSGKTTLIPHYTSVKSIQYVGQEQCFDISVPEFHNFLADGFVVHNCWNEVSRRYVDSQPELYWPTEWRKKADNKKQGSSDEVIKDVLVSKYSYYTTEEGETIEEESQDFVEIEQLLYPLANDMVYAYRKLIKNGVCPEQARMILPLNTYTEWYWTGSLAAFARVVNLRTTMDTQKETREIALQIKKILLRLFPESSKALLKEAV